MSKGYKIIYSMYTALALLIILAITTYAWVSSNRENQSTNMGLIGSDTFMNIEMNSYPVKVIDNNAGTVTYDSTVTRNTIPRYDKYNVEYQEYDKALVVKISFNGVENSGNLVLNLSVLSNSSFPNGGWDSRTEDYLSNVVEFCTVDQSRIAGETLTLLPSVSFVQVNNGICTKSQGDEIVLLSNYPIESGVENDIFIVIKYNEGAADYYCKNQVGLITFVNDLTFRISQGEAS